MSILKFIHQMMDPQLTDQQKVEIAKRREEALNLNALRKAKQEANKPPPNYIFPKAAFLEVTGQEFITGTPCVWMDYVDPKLGSIGLRFILDTTSFKRWFERESAKSNHIHREEKVTKNTNHHRYEYSWSILQVKAYCIFEMKKQNNL